MASTSRPPLLPPASDNPLPSFHLQTPIDLGDDDKTGVRDPNEAAKAAPTPGVAARTMPPTGRARAAFNFKSWVVRTRRRTRTWAVLTENAALGRLSPTVREQVGRHRTAVHVGVSLTALALVLGAGLGVRALFHTAGSSTTATATTSDAPSNAATPTPQAEPAAAVAPAEPAPVAKPRDEPTVLLDLASSLLEQKRPSEVPSIVGRLIARHPELKKDERLGNLLLRTASSSDPRAAYDSYALLTGPMEETGAALVYELSLKTDAPSAMRARAQRWLASKDFERVSPLTVYAAAKLRSAKSCEDKRALLELGSRAGGPYVLTYLKELEKKTSCAPDDLVHCYPCLRNESKLTDAIAALEKP